jgi:hypothetical protein
MKIESAKDLRVYQKAYALAMELFELSKEFPCEERFALKIKYADHQEQSAPT